MNATTSASCSSAPDSKVGSCGRWSDRDSGARLNCEQTMERGAPWRALERPEIEPSSRVRFSNLPPLHQLHVVDDDQVQAVRPRAGACFARISSTPIDGVSSMKIFASLSVPIAATAGPSRARRGSRASCARRCAPRR